MSLVQKVLGHLESLSKYLQLFERWLTMFPQKAYQQLSKCIQETCKEFLSFILEAIMYFRKPPCCKSDAKCVRRQLTFNQ